MHLTTSFYCFAARFRAIRLRAGKPDHIPLSIETGNEHWAIVMIAMWLARTNERWFTAFWGHISKPFAEAAVTKLRGTSEKFDGVISAEGREKRFHCPIVFIAEWQNVRAHGPSLASVEVLALVHAYDPETIVIGGGVMKSAASIIPIIESHVQRYAWTSWGKAQARAAEPGNDVALQGAVPLLSEKLAG